MAYSEGEAVFFKKSARFGACSAFCERTFEVGERSEVGALEGTTKNAHKQVK